MKGDKELNFLKGRIRERGESYKTISKKIGISLTGFPNKINGRQVFTIDEMDAICVELKIGTEEIPKYFFTESCKMQYSEVN